MHTSTLPVYHLLAQLVGARLRCLGPDANGVLFSEVTRDGEVAK